MKGTPEHCGHAGPGRWDVTYRWSLRRTYTITAETATEAMRLAEEAWAQDDGADMAGEPDAFTIPNHAPDDVEAEWAGDDDDAGPTTGDWNMDSTRYVDCPDCARRFDMRDEDNWARLLDHHCPDNTCPDCQGSGYIPAIGPDAPDSGYVECDTCHGTGTRA